MTVRVDVLDPTGRVTLGLYPDYPTALTARNDDVIARLDANGGYRIRVDHVIVERVENRDDTTVQEQLLSCQLGVDPSRAEPANVVDLDEARDWLTATTAGALAR